MLADFIAENMEAILQQWEEFAESLSVETEMDKAGLRDHAEAMLLSVVRQMQATQSAEQQEDKSKGLAQPIASENAAAEAHADARRAQGFDLVQLLAEFRALRASVLRLWMTSIEQPGADALNEMTRFNEAVDQELTVSIQKFSSELDRSRELFVGILSHDLRTPLGSILMSAEFLLYDDELSPTTTKVVARVHRSAKQMGAMIEELVEVTRARLSGALALNPTEIDAASICRHVVEQTKAFHPESNLRLELRGDLRVIWDGVRITRVLTNLLENAIKYGDSARPVTVIAEERKDELIISIHNEGNVIPSPVLPHLFDPFYAVEKVSHAGGLGLGLYIARTIVEQHKGTLGVKSSIEGGTAFTVCVPKKL